ncbi:hypothetical protein BDR26DRAFT_919493 [Obelidium mucronatum]|nr:hypothetical protein BDR26DRAFT_919493 [Obelidium mucronatum]
MHPIVIGQLTLALFWFAIHVKMIFDISSNATHIQVSSVRYTKLLGLGCATLMYAFAAMVRFIPGPLNGGDTSCYILTLGMNFFYHLAFTITLFCWLAEVAYLNNEIRFFWYQAYIIGAVRFVIGIWDTGASGYLFVPEISRCFFEQGVVSGNIYTWLDITIEVLIVASNLNLFYKAMRTAKGIANANVSVNQVPLDGGRSFQTKPLAERTILAYDTIAKLNIIRAGFILIYNIVVFALLNFAPSSTMPYLSFIFLTQVAFLTLFSTYEGRMGKAIAEYRGNGSFATSHSLEQESGTLRRVGSPAGTMKPSLSRKTSAIKIN